MILFTCDEPENLAPSEFFRSFICLDLSQSNAHLNRMKATPSITLGGVAARTSELAVACSRCDQEARYHLDTLIARHGHTFGIPGVLRLLAEDCQKRALVDAYDA